MDLYCVKCRARSPTRDPTTITTRNNREAVTDRCEVCGTKFFRFVKSGGDITAKLAKLPGTPWEKYPGEKQIPGYS